MERDDQLAAERPAAFWNKVYVAVIVNTLIVVTLLWAFSRYFR